MATTYVYRLFDEAGQLLYVGISKSAVTRVMQHHEDKPWASEIASYTAKRYTSRESARSAEIEAIKLEGPIYNIYDRSKAADRQREREAVFNSITEEQKTEVASMLDRLSAPDAFDWSEVQDRSIRGAMMSVASSLRGGGGIQDGIDSWYGIKRGAS